MGVGVGVGVVYVYLYIYLIYFVSGCKICSNTSPKYWCWYRVMNNLDRLAVDDIVAVFFNPWFMRVPFFEVDVYVIVTNRLFRVGSGGGGGGGGGSFPFWKNKFLGFDDDFRNVA